MGIQKDAARPNSQTNKSGGGHKTSARDHLNTIAVWHQNISEQTGAWRFFHLPENLRICHCAGGITHSHIISVKYSREGGHQGHAHLSRCDSIGPRKKGNRACRGCVLSRHQNHAGICKFQTLYVLKFVNAINPNHQGGSGNMGYLNKAIPIPIKRST